MADAASNLVVVSQPVFKRLPYPRPSHSSAQSDVRVERSVSHDDYGAFVYLGFRSPIEPARRRPVLRAGEVKTPAFRFRVSETYKGRCGEVGPLPYLHSPVDQFNQSFSLQANARTAVEPPL